MDNGTQVALPVSARDMHYAESEVIPGLFYAIRPLSYHSKTRINAELFRTGIRGVLPDEFREGLRQALELTPLDPEAHLRVVALLQVLDDGDELREDDQAFVRSVEERARRVDRAYAGLWADQYEHTRMYNWLLVKHVLAGLYIRTVDNTFEPWPADQAPQWGADADGKPSDAFLDLIQDDIAFVASEAGRLASIDEHAEKNFDSP